MPDYNKFKKLRSMFDEMGKMLSDYESGYGEQDKNIYGDQDVNNGGQDSKASSSPSVCKEEGIEGEDCSEEMFKTSGKKKNVGMLSSMLKKGLSKSGY